MPDLNSELLELLESYRVAFERIDPEAVARHLTFPWHLAGDSGAHVELRMVANAGAAHALLERLLGTYRRLGVTSVRPVEVHGLEISPRLAHVVVRWQLANAEGATVYEFRAGYTLVNTEGGWRIGATAHDELAQLRRRAERSS